MEYASGGPGRRKEVTDFKCTLLADKQEGAGAGLRHDFAADARRGKFLARRAALSH
jgi:hypothetical protein